MNTVAAANPTLNVGVFLGEPIAGRVTDNFLAIGSFQEWIPVGPDTYSWAAVPGNALLRYESYALQGCIRSLSGNTDPVGRVSDAFTLLNGLHEQIIQDIHGSNQLTPSGSWGDFDVTMEAFGPLDGIGYGVVLGFQLHVINAQISSTNLNTTS